MIKIQMEFATPEDVVAFFSPRGAPPGVVAEAPTPTTRPEKVPAAKKAAAAKTEEPAATESTAAASAAPEEKAQNSEIDFERDIAPKFLALFEAKGRDVAVAIIKKFNCKSKLSDATPDQYPEILAAIAEAAK